MLYSLEDARANVRNREGRRVFYLGRGEQLTSAARDWLQKERIEILSGEQAKPSRYQLLGGGYIEDKPEHMTHLNAQLLVPKDHPRILFRGKLDTLQSELIVCQLSVPEKRESLGEVLNLAREIMRCDVLGEALKWERLCGLTEAEQRQRSHFPQKYYAQPHFMPGAEDGIAIAQLNRVRCIAREAELAAVAAFQDGEGAPTRVDILQALNRMSSMLYILMIEQKAKL